MSLSGKPDFAGTDRYRVMRVIGVGGMGVVYEAFDRERKCRIALKTLRALDAAGRLQFKNEFRSLQDIQHPNLVSLGELHEEDGQLFFTMEFVRGVDFVVHVRTHEEGDAEPLSTREVEEEPPSELRSARTPTPVPTSYRGRKGFDEQRLRAALKQLVQGLIAIHGAQKVHRDIKPSNVLVTAEGRVVILDFGLVADAKGAGPEDVIVGTAHFMAPEQADGKAVGPEADLYSMGVMLYVALTGCYPFQFAPKVALDVKRRVEAPRPGQLVANLPEDLEALCIDLLRLDPTGRPKGRDILRRLDGGLTEEEEPSALSQRLGFVGRRNELAQLDEAFAQVREHQAIIQIVEGESGVGKSALLRQFHQQLGSYALLFSGRCYEREAVPYKAVDDLIDGLSRHLAKLPRSEIESLLPTNAELLGTIFPVLRTVTAIAEAPNQRRAVDPHELRNLVFATLRELFCKLAQERPVVITIDDLQWADMDSLALLADLMRPQQPASILLVVTARTGTEGSRIVKALTSANRSVRHLTLDRLSLGESQELAVLLLHGANLRHPINVEVLARESGGLPLFIDALVRYRLTHENDSSPVRLDEALWARIRRLDPNSQQLLELVAIAGEPLLTPIAGHAMAVELSELTREISALCAAQFVRTGGAGSEEFIELYHNRIGETIVHGLDPQVARARHSRLALSLEATGRGELETLAEHWRGAGEPERAVRYAVRAAEQAEAALAFDRAARLYRIAIGLQPRDHSARRSLLTKLGDVLSSAGRAAKAAEAYMAASDGASSMEALELGRRAAENLLRAGYVDAGMAGLRSVLAAVGMQLPKTSEQALESLLFRRAQIQLRGLTFDERDVSEVPADLIMRIEVCWSAALGLAIVDPVRSADFQARNLLLSLKAGEPYRVARSLAFEAGYIASAGAPARQRVEELLATACQIADRIKVPHALGLVQLMTGLSSMLIGQFQQSIVAFDQADTIFRERCTGVAWERSSAHSFSVWVLWYLGRIREFTRRVPLYLQAAEERGDLYLATNLRSSHSNAYWLVMDDPDTALHQTQQAIRSWSKAGFHMQTYFDLVARAQIGLYKRDGLATHRLFIERWSSLEGSLALRVQAARISLIHLRACAALAALSSSSNSADLLQQVSRATRKLEAEQVPWSAPLGIGLRAAMAHAQGDIASAVALLGDAIHGFDAIDMALYAAATRRRRGELVGGEQGRTEIEAANQWMKDQGVVNPDNMTAMLVPGFARAL